MSTVVQRSLFDLTDDIGLGVLAARVVRRQLGLGAWIDVLPGWLQALTPCSKSS